LFSDLVDESSKSDIANMLMQNPYCSVEMGNPDQPRIYENSTLASFITSESWLMFKLVKIEPTFLSKPTNTWTYDLSFNKLKTLQIHLKLPMISCTYS